MIPDGVLMTICFRVWRDFFIISFQKSFVCLALNNQCHFPSEIIAVLNSGIHPLPSGGRVNVRGITGKYLRMSSSREIFPVLAKSAMLIAVNCSEVEAI